MRGEATRSGKRAGIEWVACRERCDRFRIQCSVLHRENGEDGAGDVCGSGVRRRKEPRLDFYINIQTQLARLIGTSQPTIARLEDADYQGHSLSMLQRIAAALHRPLVISLGPQEKQVQRG